MNITITIENPNAAVLSALAGAVPNFDAEGFLSGFLKPSTAVTPAPGAQGEPSTGQPDKFPDPITSDNFDDLLEAGDHVHWDGARYTFDGVVDSVNPDAEGDEKAVFIRRDDTGKKVSLTCDDLDNYSLTFI